MIDEVGASDEYCLRLVKGIATTKVRVCSKYYLSRLAHGTYIHC